MVFTSLLFTFYFLPITIILYYISKEKYRNYILLVASLLFYSYGEPRFVLVMAGTICFDYIMAFLIDKQNHMQYNISGKIILVFTILCNVGVLFVYKYLNFSIENINLFLNKNIEFKEIMLPIGISFFTFQATSYVIDVYRGHVEVQKNPLFVALYISFFPQLIAGPIVRYSTIESQIVNRSYSFEQFAEGCKRFMLRFSKKVLIANNLSMIVGDVFALDVKNANILVLWLGSLCYSLQIFFDFSGYSDMAIGLGKMFGFKFEENFNYPYIAKSITEFWRRWHISLSQ